MAQTKEIWEQDPTEPFPSTSQQLEALTPRRQALQLLLCTAGNTLRKLVRCKSRVTLEQQEVPQKQHLICKPSLPRALLKGSLCYR